MNSSHTDDACAILLLCAFQRGETKYQPLKLEEYNRVATVLYLSGKRPGDLLLSDAISEIANDAYISADRLQWLLDRRINLGFSLEEWQRKGIWILARSDPDYPDKLRRKLRNGAPPLLFGTGNQHLLRSGGLAMIGPDSIPPRRLFQACEVAKRVSGSVIVAGHLSMSAKIIQARIEQDGCMLWVLSDGTLRQRLKKNNRQAIRDDRMILVSTHSPETLKQFIDPATVGALATGFANQILYVDGINSKDPSKRVDRFGTFDAASNQPEKCRLFHGGTLSPEGKELQKMGAELWSDRVVEL